MIMKSHARPSAVAKEVLMNHRQNVGILCWVAGIAALACGAGACGPVPGSVGAAPHVSEGLQRNPNDFILAKENHFSINVQWESPPLAKQQSVARVLFHNSSGAGAANVVICDVQLIMGCCNEAAPKPQVASQAGITPAEQSIGGIAPTRAGEWQLVIKATVDGAAVDEATWVFDAAAS